MQGTRSQRRENARIYRDFSSHARCRVILMIRVELHTSNDSPKERAGSRKSSDAIIQQECGAKEWLLDDDRHA